MSITITLTITLTITITISISITMSITIGITIGITITITVTIAVVVAMNLQTTHTIHYGRYPHNAYQVSDSWGPDYTAGFHTYKMLWDPNQLVWFVDGVERFRVTDPAMIPHEDMYLIMNVAVGGWFSEVPPDWTTPFPTHFVIDYVTVHRWQ